MDGMARDRAKEKIISQKTLRAQRYERLFDKELINKISEKKTVKGFIQLSDRQKPIQIKFNPLFMYIDQLDEHKVFDPNFFMIFWSQIKKIQTEKKDVYFVRVKLKDRRRFKLEIAERYMSLFIKTVFHNLKAHANNPEPLLTISNNSKMTVTGLNEETRRVYSCNMSFKKKKEILYGFAFNYLHSDLGYVKTAQDVETLFGLKLMVNREYKYCKSYPDIITIPKQILAEDMVKITCFRTSNRLPILSFVNTNKRCLFRSSQVYTGLLGNRCEYDEMLLYFMGEPNCYLTREEYLTVPGMRLKERNLWICDCRSKTAAVANRFMGKGYENCKKYYLNSILTFHNIANIHSVKKSLKKLQINRKLGLSSSLNFITSEYASDWYSNISDILSCSIGVVNILNKEEKNVLVHCSDGWDRTSQVCALTQIILDSKFRKIKGFLNLIEKEFSNAGFRFSSRNDLYNDKLIGHDVFINKNSEIRYVKTEDHEESPIFTQFLECVRQLMYQNPGSFQFNFHFIDELAYCHDHGLFKELMFDNQRIRRQHEKLNSMFDYFNKNFDFFVNSDHRKGIIGELANLNSDPRYFTKWSQLIFENVPYSTTALILQ